MSYVCYCKLNNDQLKASFVSFICTFAFLEFTLKEIYDFIYIILPINIQDIYLADISH